MVTDQPRFRLRLRPSFLPSRLDFELRFERQVPGAHVSIQRVLARALMMERTKQPVFDDPKRAGIQITRHNGSIRQGVDLSRAYLKTQITSMDFHILVAHNAIDLRFSRGHSKV
jgi:hypothetical protein